MRELKATAGYTTFVIAVILCILTFLGRKAEANTDVVKQITQENTKEYICLADALFHEARGEPAKGKLLVIKVIQERMKDPHWKATTACDVIYQPYQFSFTLLSKKELNQRKFNEIYDWIELLKYVNLAYDVEAPEGFQGANHYLRCAWIARTKWDDNMEFLGAVGNHCFFKGY